MNAPAYAAPRGRQPSIEWVPIAELLIDESYQRTIDTLASKRLIARIAEEWDWDVLDVLKVSRRPDDRSFVVDGQHRRAAAALRGDITQLPCVIKRCGGATDEARLFIASNRGRKTMSVLDDFRAAVGAGDAEAMRIDQLVTSAGLTVSRAQRPKGQAPGELAIVAPIRRALKLRGEPVVRQALTLIGEAFPDETIAAPAPLFLALVDMLALTEVEYDPLFATLLTGTTLDWEEWAGLKKVHGGQSRVIAMRGAIEKRHQAGGAR